MATPDIKICGITSAPAMQAAAKARASHVGLVFFPPSPRNVSPQEARRLVEDAPQGLARVGLFVDADDDLLSEAVQAAGLDAIQLHGEESPERAAQLRARFGLAVWKAIPVATAADVQRANGYEGAADLVLFDARTPRDAALPGGMGLRFDWSLVRGWRGATRWGLAGGLDPDNVSHAIAATGASLVDTSSGVESAPGVKDVDRIAAFCKAAQSA